MYGINIHPHYKLTIEPDPAKRQGPMRVYHQPETIELEGRSVPGPEGAPEVAIRIYRPK